MRLERFLTVKKIIIALSLLCYFMACVFPPFNYSDMAIDDFFGGLFCVLFGWAGILFHQGFLKIYFLAWYSNITYIFAIRYLIKSKYKHFCICSSFTLGLSYLFAFCPEVLIDESGINKRSQWLQVTTCGLQVSSFCLLVEYILFEKSKKKELSPNHKRMYTLDNQGYVDLRRKLIKSIKHIHKFIKCDFSNSSFSTSTNAIYWIKNKTFIDSVFSNTTFNA